MMIIIILITLLAQPFSFYFLQIVSFYLPLNYLF